MAVDDRESDREHDRDDKSGVHARARHQLAASLLATGSLTAASPTPSGRSSVRRAARHEQQHDEIEQQRRDDLVDAEAAASGAWDHEQQHPGQPAADHQGEIGEPARKAFDMRPDAAAASAPR